MTKINRKIIIPKQFYPRSGVPKVTAGTIVSKGDVLVEGCIPILNEDGTVKRYEYCNALCYIFSHKVMTKINRKIIIPKQFYLRLFFHDIPLIIPDAAAGEGMNLVADKEGEVVSIVTRSVFCSKHDKRIFFFTPCIIFLLMFFLNFFFHCI